MLAAPYKRATPAEDGRWVQESLQRQMFCDVLQRDEPQIAVCEVALACPGSGGRTVSAWVAATDRALHARLELAPGIRQALRLDYDRVKLAEVFRPGETSMELTYFNPDRAVDETWRLHLDPASAVPGFGSTVLQLVSQRATARAAAAARLAEAARVAAVSARPTPSAPAAGLGSEVA